MTNDNDARLQALEETLSHRLGELDDLSDMVARQWKRIDALEARLRHHEARLASVEDEIPGGASADEKPPHY